SSMAWLRPSLCLLGGSVVPRLSVDGKGNKHTGQKLHDGPKMIGEASSHSRGTRLKALVSGICSQPQAQGSQWTGKIVESIVPTAGRFQQAELLGKRQGFANQAPIHLPRGQMG